MSIRCVYIGNDPQYENAIFETAIWDFFNIVKGTVKLQFDNLRLRHLAHGWHEVPLCDVMIKTGFEEYDDQD